MSNETPVPAAPTMPAGELAAPVLQSTTDIVAAYVGRSGCAAAELPELIGKVHSALMLIVRGAEPEPAVEQQAPAVPIRKSVTPDFIICLDDGLKFKSLKRHLSTLGMTPDEYRAKWGLPSDYPMVAPNYSETRSSLAKQSGLGTKGRA